MVWESDKGYTQQPTTKVFAAEEIILVRARKLTMYALAEVEYSDIYGKNYIASSCRAIVADDTNLMQLTSGRVEEDLNLHLVTASVGNNAT